MGAVGGVGQNLKGTPVIEFQTLGTLELRGADGQELHSLLAQPKRIALLAYLCIAQPRGFHHRDTLVGLFWPSADQEHARTSLRKALHILRRSLGDDAILSRGDEEVGVDFQRVSCDTAAFEENLKANRLEKALELYRGDLLTGFFIDEAPEFERWLQSERTRLRACAARSALDLAERLASNGDVAAAVVNARRSLELADTDERALRRLMELQCNAGDRTGAVQSYDVFARHLASEYETEPSPDTRLLAEAIRAGRERFGRESEVKGVTGRIRNGETTIVPLPVAPIAPIPAVMVRGSDRGPDDPFQLSPEHLGAPRGPSDTQSGPARVHKGMEPSGRVKGILYALAALGILISTTAIWTWMRPAPPKQVVRYTLDVDSAEPMAPIPPWAGRLAISPDGSLLAYIGGRNAHLLVRPRNHLNAIAVPETEGTFTPFFSPDGKNIGILRERNVQIAAVSGGQPVTVSDALTGVAGASWGPDGFIYVDGQYYVSLVRVEAKPGGVPKWFTVLDTASGEVDHSWPDALPNGKGVLFTVTFDGKTRLAGRPSRAIAVAEIPSGKHRVLVNDAMYARYAASGHLLYVTSNRTLMVAPFDEKTMTITGEPTALIEGIRVGTFGSTDVAVSAAGTLLYSTGAWEGRRELAWITRDGKAQSVDPDWRGDFGAPALSPDGKRLAVSRRIDGLTFHVWVKQLDRGPDLKLSLEGIANDYPTWTPDGRSVTFTSETTGSVSLWTKRADGSAQAVLQWREKRGALKGRWSPDGKWLVFQTDSDTPGSGDILGIRPGIDTVSVPLVASRFTELSPAISPDGRWLAYSSDETGQYEAYVVPFPNTSAAKWAVSTRGGTEPEWAHSGRELFYRDGARNLVAVDVKISPTFSLGRSVVLFSGAGFYPYFAGQRYAVAPDDRRFLFVRPLAPGTPDRVIVVDNWFEELKAKSRQ